jgi:hypothetical protein
MANVILAKGIESSISGDVTAISGPMVADPIAELAFATVVLVVIIVFHGWCLGRVTKFFSRRFALYSPATPRWRVTSLTGVTVAGMVIIHLFETLLWAAPIWQLAIIAGFRDAYYFVLEAYTTLGEGTVALPDQWRLAGPVIAISGLFTFGWTTGVLVYVMNEIGKLHSQTSRLAAGVGEPRGGQS